MRSQIDILTLPKETIPWFFIHERDGDRYINRLAGTSMVEGVGFEPTGRYLDDLMAPEIYPERKALFDRCVSEGVCIHYRAALAAPDRHHVGFSRILFPVASDREKSIDLVCGTMVFFNKAGLSPEERTAIADGSSGILLYTIYKDGRWQSADPG